jgi:hypothetical protein
VRDIGITLGASLPPAVLDRDGAALDPTEFAQPLHKGSNPILPNRIRGRARAQEADCRHRRLLCPRRERPCRRAAEQGDELAASEERSHLIPPPGRAREDSTLVSPCPGFTSGITTPRHPEHGFGPRQDARGTMRDERLEVSV